jgi:hypothetical protein
MLIIVTTFTGVFPYNMPTTRIFVLLCMAFTLRAKGQYEYMDGFTIDYKNRHDKIIEIQGTFGIGHYSVGFRRLNMFRIDLEKQWYWGIGLRLNAGYSVGGNFLTANPSITRKSKAIMAVLSEPDPFSTDTLIPSRVIGGEACFQWLIQRNIRPNLEVSFLMDIAGLNFSLPSTASVVASGAGNPAAVNVGSSLLNLNLFSDHTRGNIRYEVLCRYWLNDKWGISGGPGFMFREIRSGIPVSEAMRFRKKQWAFNLALVWAPYHKKYKD